jgi:hypothetical protein
MKYPNSKLMGKKPKRCKRRSIDGRNCSGNGFLDDSLCFFRGKRVCSKCFENLKYFSKLKRDCNKVTKIHTMWNSLIILGDKYNV